MGGSGDGAWEETSNMKWAMGGTPNGDTLTPRKALSVAAIILLQVLKLQVWATVPAPPD